MSQSQPPPQPPQQREPSDRGVDPSADRRNDRVLIRQALIEEAERRRIGRALHDVVAQSLAHLRAQITERVESDESRDRMLATLDGVIESVRTLSFELSPPILEDLGLLPALGWLAQHLGKRYSTPIAVAHDGREPALDSASRTILFGVVRELVVNAAKHAAGSAIDVSCVSNHRTVRVIVRDEGPGFDTRFSKGSADDGPHFGLLSVEQQIRGIGGTFELVSAPGEGTRATITVNLSGATGADHA